MITPVVVTVEYTAAEVDHFARLLAREFEDGGCDPQSRTYALLSELVRVCPKHVPEYVRDLVKKHGWAA